MWIFTTFIILILSHQGRTSIANGKKDSKIEKYLKLTNIAIFYTLMKNVDLHYGYSAHKF